MPYDPDFGVPFILSPSLSLAHNTTIAVFPTFYIEFWPYYT